MPFTVRTIVILSGIYVRYRLIGAAISNESGIRLAKYEIGALIRAGIEGACDLATHARK